MKRKLWFGFLVLVLFTAAITGIGWTKMTGGGWFIDSTTGSKISIGFNGIPQEGDFVVGEYTMRNAKGQFQLIDHETGDKIHCNFLGTQELDGKPYVSHFVGSAKLNGEDGYYASLQLHNDVDYGTMGAGDFIAVSVLNPDLTPVVSYSGFLVEGTAEQHPIVEN